MGSGVGVDVAVAGIDVEVDVGVAIAVGVILHSASTVARTRASTVASISGVVPGVAVGSRGVHEAIRNRRPATARYWSHFITVATMIL